MRAGYYSDKYFVRAREILLADHHRPRVTMQVFGKTHAFLGGMDEAVAILKLCAVEWQDLVVHALFDGDEVEPWETVMLDRGPVRRLRPPRDPLPRRHRRAAPRSAPTPGGSSRRRAPRK